MGYPQSVDEKLPSLQTYTIPKLLFQFFLLRTL